jgi:hypothetical protein
MIARRLWLQYDTGSPTLASPTCACNMCLSGQHAHMCIMSRSTYNTAFQHPHQACAASLSPTHTSSTCSLPLSHTHIYREVPSVLGRSANPGDLSRPVSRQDPEARSHPHHRSGLEYPANLAFRLARLDHFGRACPGDPGGPERRGNRHSVRRDGEWVRWYVCGCIHVYSSFEVHVCVYVCLCVYVRAPMRKL